MSLGEGATSSRYLLSWRVDSACDSVMTSCKLLDMGRDRRKTAIEKDNRQQESGERNQKGKEAGCVRTAFLVAVKGKLAAVRLGEGPCQAQSIPS